MSCCRQFQYRCIGLCVVAVFVMKLDWIVVMIMLVTVLGATSSQQQSSQPPRHQSTATVFTRASELPHDQHQDVMSAVMETKRFYGNSRLICQQVANKLDVGPTGDVSRRCGRNRKLPARYLETA